MKSVHDIIESGLLEVYALGAATPEERAEVEALAAAHEEVRRELDSICESLEQYARAQAVTPPVTVKPLLLASVNYLERMKKGEPVAEPPELGPHSRIADYAPWLNQPALAAPAGEEEIYVHLIAATPRAITAVVWLQDSAPNEIHHDLHERFLVVSGTCEITIGDTVHSMNPGDFIAIPLHVPHSVRVTSAEPCQVVLQRIAA